LAKALPDMPAIEVSNEVARAIPHAVGEHTDRFCEKVVHAHGVVRVTVDERL
jgi:hypothetical protein